ncbi:MAG TPA: fumarylacetoacetate hydrolase family protein [Solirubrobacteraceae bacterium]|jgi:2-keto-4-pentenoate hydratase/2-oxohepta-3-ene-1,7-dioic acid hydratase in catechol pathway|nr:fumarylacetoacetate hydrolase family protein [Solirubrobacteraceae bacterium]
MKIARVLHDGQPRTAVIDGESAQVLDKGIEAADVLGVDPSEREVVAGRVQATLPLSETRLLAPVQPPTMRDFSVFEQHIEGVIKDANADATVPPVWYESPFCYFTNPHAVTGPGDEIPVPPGCRRLDFELEVAAVIGRPGRDLAPADASDYIAGYTIFNDWSARDLQMAEMRLGLGICKGKDFANTLGPWIVTPDELEPYRDGDRFDLELHAELNGSSLGRDTLANMAWSFAELVSYASRGTWVRPGDVLGSGTCGNGCLLELWGRHGRDGLPPLQPGDVVSLHAEGIGTLTNTVVAGLEPFALPAARTGRRAPRSVAG